MSIQDDSKKDKGPTVKDILHKLDALGYMTTVFGAGGTGGGATPGGGNGEKIPYGPKASAEGTGFPPRHGSVIGAAGLDQVQPRANYEAIKGWAPVPPGKPAESVEQRPHGVPVQSAFGKVYVVPRQFVNDIDRAQGGPGVSDDADILFVKSVETITLLMDILPMKRWSFDNDLLHANIAHIILDPEAGAELTFAWEV